jgi:hypothetical protein
MKCQDTYNLEQKSKPKTVFELGNLGARPITLVAYRIARHSPHSPGRVSVRVRSAEDLAAPAARNEKVKGGGQNMILAHGRV